MSFSHLILCRPLLLPPSILPSIRVLEVSSLHQVAKVLAPYLRILPSGIYHFRGELTIACVPSQCQVQ